MIRCRLANRCPADVRPPTFRRHTTLQKFLYASGGGGIDKPLSEPTVFSDRAAFGLVQHALRYMYKYLMKRRIKQPVIVVRGQILRYRQRNVRSTTIPRVRRQAYPTIYLAVWISVPNTYTYFDREAGR
jgi:hypothetical protein